MPKTVALVCGLPGAGKSTILSPWRRSGSSDSRTELSPQMPMPSVVIEYDTIHESLLLSGVDPKATPVGIERNVDGDGGGTRKSVNASDSTHRVRDDTMDREEENTTIPAEHFRDSAVCSPFNRRTWRQSRSEALSTLTECLRNNRVQTILMDDNFYLRSMRKQVYHCCQEYVQESNQAVYWGVIFLRTPVAVCLERNQQRRDKISSLQRETTQLLPDTVITRMAERWEVPNPDRFRWEQPLLIIDGLQRASDNEIIVKNFLQRLPIDGDPVPPPSSVVATITAERIASERQRTKESFLHQLDCFLRHCVQRVAALVPGMGSIANRIRKQLLLDVSQRASSCSPFQSLSTHTCNTGYCDQKCAGTAPGTAATEVELRKHPHLIQSAFLERIRASDQQQSITGEKWKQLCDDIHKATGTFFSHTSDNHEDENI